MIPCPSVKRPALIPLLDELDEQYFIFTSYFGAVINDRLNGDNFVTQRLNEKGMIRSLCVIRWTVEDRCERFIQEFKKLRSA